MNKSPSKTSNEGCVRTEERRTNLDDRLMSRTFEPGTIVRMPLAPPAEDCSLDGTSKLRGLVSSSDSSGLRDVDAFLFFSDDARRMSHITGGDAPSGEAASSSSSQQSPPVRRKTCLSFEVHPSVVLDDLVASMGLDDGPDFIDEIASALGYMGVNEAEDPSRGSGELQ